MTRPLYSLNEPIVCDQCVDHSAVKWLVTKTTINVPGYESRSVWQVRALCQEYFDEWKKRAENIGAEVFTYDISNTEQVYKDLEKNGPYQLGMFDGSFVRKEY